MYVFIDLVMAEQEGFVLSTQLHITSIRTKFPYIVKFNILE